MRTNKFDVACTSCKTMVRTGEGLLVGPHGGWKTYCVNCTPQPPARGDHVGWHQMPLATLDFETTGVDPHTDRVISYALIDDQGVEYVGLVNPGIPIPPASAVVHGISDDDVANAPTPDIAIAQLVALVDDLVDRGVGLVVFNASYDLTMLRAEASRHGIAQPAWDRLLVVDPLVIDWGIEHGRLGPRKLTDVSAYYRVVIDNAHDATCDAVAARDVAYEMGFRHATVAAHSLTELQDRQREWFAERVADWNRYAVTKGWSLDDPTGWPLGINQD